MKNLKPLSAVAAAGLIGGLVPIPAGATCSTDRTSCRDAATQAYFANETNTFEYWMDLNACDASYIRCIGGAE